MTRPWVTAAVLLLVAGGTSALVAASMLTKEPHSAFSDGRAAAIVEEADALGWDARRWSSRPEALGHDPGAAPGRTVLAVMGPPRPYNAAEAAAVEDFVAAGGTLLVADNFGHGNSLTSRFGIAFERVRLVEPSPSWMAQLDGRSYPFHPVEPTALRVAGSTDHDVLAWSSLSSFVDRDGDGIIATGDPAGPFPVLVQATHADGRVLALADPAPLGDAPTPDDRAWLRAVLDHLLPEGGLLLVDESAATDDPLLASISAQRSAAAAPPWRHVVTAAAVAMLASLFLPHVWRRWGPHRFRPHRFVRRAQATGERGRRPTALTQRGVAAVAAAAALALLALLHGSMAAAYASGMLLAVLGVACQPRRPRLRAQRTVSSQRLDEGARMEVAIELAGRRGGEVEFHDHAPSEFDVREGTNWFRAAVPAGGLVVRYTVSPALRGPYDIGPLRVRWNDPLGLCGHEVPLVAATPVRVNPRQESVRRLPFNTRIPTITLGPHFVNRAGEGSEFHALRGYQSGDPMRSVNWKASARSKGLVVNQRVHESMAHLTIFLDARAISGVGPVSATPLANSCRTVLSVGTGALRVRDRLRILVYGDGVREIPPMPASRQSHEMTDLLSSLPAAGETTFGEAVKRILPTLKPGAPAMLASGLEDDPTIVDGMRLLRSHGVAPFVVAAQLGVEPVDAEDGGPEPDADQLLRRRDETISKLRSMNIQVFDAVPGVTYDNLFRLGGGL